MRCSRASLVRSTTSWAQKSKSICSARSPIRHRPGGEPARGHEQHDAPPVVRQRRERELHLADDLRPQMQRVAGVGPVRIGERRPGVVGRDEFMGETPRPIEASRRRALRNLLNADALVPRFAGLNRCGSYASSTSATRCQAWFCMSSTSASISLPAVSDRDARPSGAAQLGLYLLKIDHGGPPRA